MLHRTESGLSREWSARVGPTRRRDRWEPPTTTWRPRAVIREDRLLLAELARLNTDVAPLAMRIMDQSATAEEQYVFAERLAAMARWLQSRAAHAGAVIDGEIVITTDQNANGRAGMAQHRDL